MGEQDSKDRASWREILRFVRLGPALFLVLAVNVAGGFLSGGGDPFFLKLLIDSLGTGDTRRFVLLGLSLLGIYTGVRVLNYVSALLAARMKNEICETTSLAMLRRFYGIPYEQVAEKEEGYFASRIYDEPANVTGTIDLVVRFASAVATFTGGLIVCLWVAWEMALVLSVIVPALLFLSKKFGKKIRKSTEEEVESQADLRANLGRAVRGYRTVRLFSLEKGTEKRMHGFLKTYLDALYGRLRYGALFSMGSSLLLSYAEMSVMLGIGFFVLRGDVTVGGMFGFISAYWRVVNGVQSINGLVPAYARIQTQVARLKHFEALSELPQPPRGGSTVELEGIEFSFGDVTILQNLSLRLGHGERLLVVGPNGSGKSTLANVVTGFLEPQEGSFQVPAIKDISALLLPFEFAPGTVRQGLEAQELSAEQRSYRDRLFQDFGLTHALDQDPTKLSEGQKRKFQVCMTLLKEADVYVFDEPLSAVEVSSWDMVMRHIFERTRGKGLMVIMHGAEKYHGEFDRVLRLGEQQQEREREDRKTSRHSA